MEPDAHFNFVVVGLVPWSLFPNFDPRRGSQPRKIATCMVCDAQCNKTHTMHVTHHISFDITRYSRMDDHLHTLDYSDAPSLACVRGLRMSDRSGALPGISDASHRSRRLTYHQHEAQSRPARRHRPVDATERRCQMASNERVATYYRAEGRLPSPGNQPAGRLTMWVDHTGLVNGRQRAHRRPKPTVERLSRAARSSVTVPCSSTATLQDAWRSFMTALQPADPPAPAVCSLVALEGHDGRGALKWPLLHLRGWDALRASLKKFSKFRDGPRDNRESAWSE